MSTRTMITWMMRWTWIECDGIAAFYNKRLSVQCSSTKVLLLQLLLTEDDHKAEQPCICHRRACRYT
jgi:hypothetical protein